MIIIFFFELYLIILAQNEKCLFKIIYEKPKLY